MEADWTVALAADDPVLIVPWSGLSTGTIQEFVDLRLGAHLIDEIEEARNRPALRSALLLLNGAESALWTAKCDAWSSNEVLDPYEMSAAPEDAGFGAGSYIDLLPRDTTHRCSFRHQEQWVRNVTESLRAIPARTCRVELVVRHALVEAVPGFAVSWFVEGCGATAERAAQAWSGALVLALRVILDTRLM